MAVTYFAMKNADMARFWVRKGMENREADEKEDCKASCGRRGLECISLCVCMRVHYMLATHLRVKSSVL